jgi:hypothetical protein
MSHVTKTALWLMASLPVSTVAVVIVYYSPYLLLLPGEPFKGVPLVMQFVILGFCLSVPAFAVGLLLLIADYIRARRQKRTSSA